MRISIAAALFALAGPAMAATFNVGNGADLPDLQPGDGKCSFMILQPNQPASPDLCTLRAAIMEANATPEHDTILLPDNSYFLLTRPGRDENYAATGDLDIRNPVTIRPTSFWLSGSATIDGNGLDRVFDVIGVHGNGVTLRGMTIKGGDFGDNLNNRAGGISIISSKANLSYLNVSAIKGIGIRIYSSVDNQDTTVSYSTITSAGEYGGPMAVVGGLATIESSALVNSKSIGLEVQQPDTEVHVNNSTISGNSLYGISASFGAYALVTNSTIADNGHNEGNSGWGLRVGGQGSVVEVKHSLLAGNRMTCSAYDSGAFIMKDNLFDDDSCPHGGGGDQSLVAPAFLSLLGNHGGPTPTHRPMINSPALDFVTGTCPDESDQRLKQRNVAFTGEDAFCDLGAVELETDVIFFDQVDRL